MPDGSFNLINRRTGVHYEVLLRDIGDGRHAIAMVPSAPTATPSIVLVTGQMLVNAAGAIAVAPARDGARSVLIANLDAGIACYVGGDDAVTKDTGMPLMPGRRQEYHATGAIYVIAASGTPLIAFADEYEVSDAD